MKPLRKNVPGAAIHLSRPTARRRDRLLIALNGSFYAPSGLGDPPHWTPADRLDALSLDSKSAFFLGHSVPPGDDGRHGNMLRFVAVGECTAAQPGYRVGMS